MNAFERMITAYQTDWRTRSGNDGKAGRQNGREYQHILPATEWEKGLWPQIASPLIAYLHSAGVQPHTGFHNLKSSWILCANLYFPFGQDGEGKALLGEFLRQHLHQGVDTVDSVELEYAEAGELAPAELLGETGGSRGSGQTSPDLGIRANGGRALLLIESKFTEHSFYRCSARRTIGSVERPGNPDVSRCLRPTEVRTDPAGACHQSSWGRKYWGILSEVAGGDVDGLPSCPAAFSGYQLFRQQALAEGIARSGTYDLVISAVAYDERNKTLIRSLSSLGLSSIEDWGRLFTGKACFGAYTHQEWVSFVARHGGSRWRAWCRYVHDRYGYSASGA